MGRPASDRHRPVIYTLAAVMIYLTGGALYNPRVGFRSAIAFATLLGVSHSSLLITTDVLVLFWSIVLFAWAMLVKRQSMAFAHGGGADRVRAVCAQPPKTAFPRLRRQNRAVSLGG